MQKKAILALMLALTLLLSGCTLVAKDAAVDAAQVIIRSGDVQITKAELQSDIQEQMRTMSYYYSLYGYSFDASDPEILADIQNSVIQSREEDFVIRQQVEANGLDQLTEEEESEIKESAQSSYDAILSSYKNTVSSESEEEMDDEALTAAALERMSGLGITLENYQESERDTLLRNKLRDFVVKDVTVSEDEVKQEYNSRVESAKTTYETDASAYCAAVNNGTTIYYVPEGVRRVKQILIKFHEEDQTAINEANSRIDDANSAVSTANATIASLQETLDTEGISEEMKAETQSSLEAAQNDLANATGELEAAQAALKEATDAAFANLDEETDALLAELENGADWDTLMAEKNQDPGMQSGVTAEKGYAISKDMTSFDSAFVEAGMALEKPGDISGKVRGETYGYYIIRYVGDETPGEIGLDTVRETVEDSVLSTKKDETYDTTLQQWIKDANFQVDMEALNN